MAKDISPSPQAPLREGGCRREATGGSNAPPAPAGEILQGCTPERLAELAAAAGAPAWRARQLWQWLQQRHAFRWDEMSNLPRDFKDTLAAAGHSPEPFAPLETLADPLGTTKWLLGLRDGETVEMVRIPAGGGRETVCVSSQVGCRMGCAFCATAKSGFARSLSAGEIVSQVHFFAREIGRRPDNVVFMGMGEPFDNYDAVMAAVRLLNHPDGINIGARKITISTCGVLEGIRRLGDEGLQVELSVSLHAPNPEIRRRLMPAERRWPMDEILAECKRHTERTKRIVTFEYTLVRGVNDQPLHARELASRLRTFPCRVNLIPLSPVPEFTGEAPSPGTADAFLAILRRAGINGTIRESRGKDVRGACGQLRRAARSP